MLSLQFDWTNPEEFSCEDAALKLEEHMIQFLFLKPEEETPTFDRKKNLVIVNKDYKFHVPGKLKQYIYGGRMKRKGFTLIELLLVIAIVGIVLAIVVPAIVSQRHLEECPRLDEFLMKHGPPDKTDKIVDTALLYYKQPDGSYVVYTVDRFNRVSGRMVKRSF